MNTQASEHHHDHQTRINFFHSINTRLMALTIAIALIPLIITIYIGTTGSEAVIRNTIQGDLITTTKAESAAITDWLQQQVNYINYLSTTPALRTLKPEQVAPVLLEARTQMKTIDSLFLVDKNGMQIYDTNVELGNTKDLANMGDRDYFKRAIQGETLIADPLISKITGKLALILAAPVKDESGKPVAVLATAITLDTITSKLKELEVGQTGEA
jgi:methyl-accepting chemotaxis protein